MIRLVFVLATGVLLADQLGAANEFYGNFQGAALLVDTKVESPATYDGSSSTASPRAGETLEFQLFVPLAAGRQTLGYNLGFSATGIDFLEYFSISGRDFSGSPIVVIRDEPVASAILISRPTYPSSGHIGTITLTALRDVPPGTTVFLTGRTSLADVNSAEDLLDVSQATVDLVDVDFVPVIPGDLDLNGSVDFSDFLTFASNFGASGPVPSPIIPRTILARDTVIVRDTLTVSNTSFVRDTIEVERVVTQRDTIEIERIVTRVDTVNVSEDGQSVRYEHGFHSSVEISSWFKRDGGAWSVAEGRLRASGSRDMAMRIGPNQFFEEDIDVSVSTVWKNGVVDTGYGLIFHKFLGEYRFLISGNGAFLLIKIDPSDFSNEHLIDWTWDPAIVSEGSNRLRVITKGSEIRLYVNGTRVGTVVDETNTFGWVNFEVGHRENVWLAT
jgi:hypothetical protein